MNRKRLPGASLLLIGLLMGAPGAIGAVESGETKTMGFDGFTYSVTIPKNWEFNPPLSSPYASQSAPYFTRVGAPEVGGSFGMGWAAAEYTKPSSRALVESIVRTWNEDHPESPLGEIRDTTLTGLPAASYVERAKGKTSLSIYAVNGNYDAALRLWAPPEEFEALQEEFRFIQEHARVAWEKQKVVELAKEDLAKLLGVNKDSIMLKSAEEVTWPDTALGYPEEGHGYLQVLTHGYRIILSYGGKDYEYHTSTKNVKLDPKLR